MNCKKFDAEIDIKSCSIDEVNIDDKERIDFRLVCKECGSFYYTFIEIDSLITNGFHTSEKPLMLTLLWYRNHKRFLFFFQNAIIFCQKNLQ